jgi:hypothetical protein
MDLLPSDHAGSIPAQGQIAAVRADPRSAPTNASLPLLPAKAPAGRTATTDPGPDITCNRSPREPTFAGTAASQDDA